MERNTESNNAKTVIKASLILYTQLHEPHTPQSKFHCLTHQLMDFTDWLDHFTNHI